MTPKALVRWGASSAVLAGLLNPLVDFLSPGSDSAFQWAYFVGGVALQFALIGIYAIQVKETGITGFLGFILAFIGRAYFSVPTAAIGGIDGTVPLGLLYTLGLVLLAVGSLKAGKLPRWVPTIWIVAVIIGLTGAFLPSGEALSSRLGALVLGLGFIGAGLSLWARKLAA